MTKAFTLPSSELAAPECPLARPRRAPAAFRELPTTMERLHTTLSSTSAPSLSRAPTMADLPTASSRASMIANTPRLEMRMVLRRTSVLSHMPPTLVLRSMSTMESPRMVLRRILVPSHTPTTRRTRRTTPTQLRTPISGPRSTSRPRDASTNASTSTTCSVMTPQFRNVRLPASVSVWVPTPRTTTMRTRTLMTGTADPPLPSNPNPAFVFFACFAFPSSPFTWHI
ncbi:hypothetical protein F5B21DRAFT_315882 [Xylaria acuta]|nr:hypothetical protein F5B21DRAFT_315882 [Xylaria acuta]